MEVRHGARGESVAEDQKVSEWSLIYVCIHYECATCGLAPGVEVVLNPQNLGVFEKVTR